MTAATRVFRSIAQSLASFALALPTLTAGFNVTPANSAKYAGIVAGLVALVAAVQNVLEANGVVPTLTTAAKPVVAQVAPPAAPAALPESTLSVPVGLMMPTGATLPATVGGLVAPPVA